MYMYICIYMYIYMNIYIYMYTCIYMYIYIYMDTYMYIYISNLHIKIHLHVHLHLHGHMHPHVHIHLHVHLHVHLHEQAAFTEGQHLPRHAEPGGSKASPTPPKACRALRVQSISNTSQGMRSLEGPRHLPTTQGPQSNSKCCSHRLKRKAEILPEDQQEVHQEEDQHVRGRGTPRLQTQPY